MLVLIGLFVVIELFCSILGFGYGVFKIDVFWGCVLSGVGFIIWWYKGGVVCGGLLGIMIGVLFGVGVDIVLWISYVISCKLFWILEKYGIGYLEGLVLVSVVNNVVLLGVYIFVLVFGIFGDIVMVIIIGVLIMKGIILGLDVFIE